MKHLLRTAAVLSLPLITACASTPNYEKITNEYINCGGAKPQLVEFMDHEWYKSWYAHCNGQEYFCRYAKNNEGGWNGCRATNTGK